MDYLFHFLTSAALQLNLFVDYSMILSMFPSSLQSFKFVIDQFASLYEWNDCDVLLEYRKFFRNLTFATNRNI